MEFSDLQLNPRILDAVKKEGYVTPTPIQVQAVPPALKGRDILGCAQTGTGKTAAFAMPILHLLSKADNAAASQPYTSRSAPQPEASQAPQWGNGMGTPLFTAKAQPVAEPASCSVAPGPSRPTTPNAPRPAPHDNWAKPKDKSIPHIRALILSPTRELSMQIHESFRTYGRYLKLKYALIMGGVKQYAQEQSLLQGADILTATPGRLLDLYAQGFLDFSRLEIFVLDEADRMLDMGFIHDVKRIIDIIPKKRQTLFFTATMPPDVRKLAETLLYNPVSVAVTPVSSTVEATSQTVYLTDKVKKLDLITWLMLNDNSIRSALIFTRTKYGADKLSHKLKQAGVNSMSIHGDKSQGARQNALASFKNGSIRALVATDIAARGIDIEDLSHVINYELPNEPETYVHRIGRTGRAGKTGIAVSLCDFDEKEYLADIEKLIRKKITVIEKHPYPMEVFEKSPPKVKPPRPNRRRV